MQFVSDTLSVLSPPNRSGWPFILGGLVVAFIGLFVAKFVVWIGVLFALFCLFFFRDPERVPPPRRSVIVAAADGRVASVVQAAPPPELGLGDTPRWRVATFLSVLDVHINRVPAAGRVTRVVYRAGAFVSAALDKASADNERNALAIQLADGRDIAVVQIAGLIARRIVCHVSEGDPVQAGARFGLIRFGSRTDVYLPIGVEPLVAEGQRMVGGETVLADLGRFG